MPHARPVKQKLRRLHPRWSLQVKEEIQKQLSVGFISVVEYPEWLANVVPVPKKDGKVRVCVDFRDLNKASPKDDFPLPHIDLLVGTAAIRCLGYFITGYAIWVEECKADHLAALERFFERIRKFRLRLNPKKCTFGVTSGKLLGHMVSERGIEVDPDKIKAILDMPVPRTEKEIGVLRVALVWATRRLRHYMTEYSVHLISRLDPLRYLFDRPALAGRLMRWLVLLTEWHMYFDGAANHSGYGIGVLLVSPRVITSEICSFNISDHPTTNNIFVVEDRDVKLKPYHAYLELLIEKFEELKYIHLPRAHNQFADALATLASTVNIPTNVVVRPLLIETRSAPAYCHLIDETEVQDDLPWFHDIRQFLRFGTYPEAATAKDRRALRQEVHAGVCGPHMGGHMLARKIMRTGYFWLTMETDCCQFVQRCPECQMHGDLIHYGIQHHRSSAYRPQTNGAVEAANKNIKRIRERWSRLLEIEMGSLRVALERDLRGSGPRARFDRLTFWMRGD
ncbi:hypothetical protein AAG906_037146 [Vitis piasezkii]